MYQLDFAYQIRFAKIGMKFYGGQSSNANKTESDKKYSSIFHDLKFFYYVYKNFCQSNPRIFNKFNKNVRKENV